MTVGGMTVIYHLSHADAASCHMFLSNQSASLYSQETCFNEEFSLITYFFLHKNLHCTPGLKFWKC